MSEVHMKKIFEKKYMQCIAVIPLVIAVYILWSLLCTRSTNTPIKLIMAVASSYAAVSVINCSTEKQLSCDKAIKAVILAGIVMRIGYMLYTPCNVRSHDLYEFSSKGAGHAAYLLWLIENSSLPQSNDAQFYQQPFFYMVGCVFSRLINAVLPRSDVYILVDAAKTVSCAASCMVLIIAESLCDIFMLKDREKLAAMLIAAFQPCFLLSIRITPDILCTFFMTLALLFTFKWYESPDWKNTIILALTYGFGVMTKISVGVPALFTAAVFAVKLVSHIKEKKAAPLFAKLAVFGIISLPLGLWYSIRNFILFEQKPWYVLKIAEGENSTIYVGDRSLLERFVIPDFKSIFTSPYIDIDEEYNYFVYSVKNSLFGEFSFDVPKFIPTVLFILALILSIAAIAAAVSPIIRYKEDKKTAVLSAVCIMFIGSIAAFWINYPHICSIDFRYSTFLIIPFAILLAKLSSSFKNVRLGNALYICTLIYSFSSCLMYIMI